MRIFGDELDSLQKRDEALAERIGKGMVDVVIEGMSQLDDWEVLRPRITRWLEGAETV